MVQAVMADILRVGLAIEECDGIAFMGGDGVVAAPPAPRIALAITSVLRQVVVQTGKLHLSSDGQSPRLIPLTAFCLVFTGRFTVTFAL